MKAKDVKLSKNMIKDILYRRDMNIKQHGGESVVKSEQETIEHYKQIYLDNFFKLSINIHDIWSEMQSFVGKNAEIKALKVMEINGVKIYSGIVQLGDGDYLIHFTANSSRGIIKKIRTKFFDLDSFQDGHIFNSFDEAKKYVESVTEPRVEDSLSDSALNTFQDML